MRSAVGYDFTDRLAKGESLCKGENPHSDTNISEISKDNTAPQWAWTFPSAQIIFSTFHSSQV